MFKYTLIMMNLITLNSFANIKDVGSNALDKDLQIYINKFKFSAVDRKDDYNVNYIKLGSKLYGDLRLSLTGDKSCFTCHLDFLNTGDDLPLSLGVGTIYSGTTSGIFQNTAMTTKRNSTHLYNKGHEDFKSYFADGRVALGKTKWITPDPKFNSNDPEYKKIRNIVSNALAVQALFPMIDNTEMKGHNHDDLSNIEVWDKITKSLVSDPNLKKFFYKAFPGEDINIGHIAQALAHFQKYYFQVTQTPWDRYLRGEKNALTDSQKKGAVLFSTKAKCAKCHSGKHLTNFKFENTLIPGNSQDKNAIDFGRYDHTINEHDKFKTQVLPLRNIGRTKPYFTSGIVLTLKEVINHYNKPKEFFKLFTPTVINNDYVDSFKIFNKYFYRTGNTKTDTFQLDNASPKLPMSLGLTQEEKDYLEDFLKNALTESEDKVPEDLKKHISKDTWVLPL